MSGLFQLRDEHMQALGGVAEDNFVDRAIPYFKRNFPRETAEKSDENLRARVRRDIERAKPFGFTTERQVMRYGHAGYLLGEEFAQDPEYAPWLRPLLDPQQGPAEERSRQLLKRAIQTYPQGNPRGV